MIISTSPLFPYIYIYIYVYIYSIGIHQKITFLIKILIILLPLKIYGNRWLVSNLIELLVRSSDYSVKSIQYKFVD